MDLNPNANVFYPYLFNLNINNINNHNVNNHDINNRIVDINDNLMNINPVRIIIGNLIYYIENGVTSNVDFVSPNNWVDYYEQDPNNNYYTIRICYEYYLISYYRDIDRLIEHLNLLNAIGADNINNGGLEINNINNSINVIRNNIQIIGNIYLGILLQQD